MELAGWSDISVGIQLRSTCMILQIKFSIRSPKHLIDRLDLQQAIDAIIPDDNVGNEGVTAQSLNFATGKVDGWINSLDDTDVYRFAAGTGPAHGILMPIRSGSIHSTGRFQLTGRVWVREACKPSSTQPVGWSNLRH